MNLFLCHKQELFLGKFTVFNGAKIELLRSKVDR